MDVFQEVVVVSDSDKNNNCTIYDLHHANEIKSFNGGNSAKHSLAFIGQDYVVSGFKDKPHMKIWTLSNSHFQEKQMTVPGIVSCLTVSNCGTYCIVGIEKSIYIWEVSSGSLLTSLQYHSKTVSSLQISSDLSHFVSGGKDGMALVWLLSEVIGDSEKSNNAKPRYSWIDHCAEVTDIYIGGIGIYARVVTASKDMTCRIYELETGFPLVTINVDYAITAVIMDNLEYFLILGTAEGDIYRINLFSADGTELHYNKADTKFSFLGHTKEITCLSLSLSGKYLVSGSEDEQCIIWDMANLSLIRRIPCTGAVTNAFIAILPPGLNEQETNFSPKINASLFKRQYDNDKDASTITRIQSKKLSLFHLGAADEFVDSKMLTKSAESINAFNQFEVTMKDVTTINAQMYAFALSDTISEMGVSSNFDTDDSD